MSWHRIDLPQPLAPGEKHAVRVGEHEVLVCRVGDEYFAVANRCTHSAWPLANEPLEGEQIVCTLHGARFDLRDGCPTGGPARKPLATYPVEPREGDLYVSL